MKWSNLSKFFGFKLTSLRIVTIFTFHEVLLSVSTLKVTSMNAPYLHYLIRSHLLLWGSWILTAFFRLASFVFTPVNINRVRIRSIDTETILLYWHFYLAGTSLPMYASLTYLSLTPLSFFFVYRYSSIKPFSFTYLRLNKLLVWSIPFPIRHFAPLFLVSVI